MYWVAKALRTFFLLLPMTVQRQLGNFLGWLVWLAVSSRRKRMMLENVGQTLGVSGKEAYRIAKASVTRFGQIMVDIFQYPRISRANIGDFVRLHGAEHFETALAHGCGAVVASGHCGNWELMGVSFAYYGYPVVGVTVKQKGSGFERFMQESRRLSGGTVLYKDGLRDVVRIMGENKMPLIFFDLDGKDKGIFVKFLGRWASTPPGAAILARMKNAPILPAFIVQAEDGKHDLYIHEPLWVDMEADKDKAAHDVMQHLSDLLEQEVRRRPEDWYWLHDRWRTKKPQ